MRLMSFSFNLLTRYSYCRSLGAAIAMVTNGELTCRADAPLLLD